MKRILALLVTLAALSLPAFRLEAQDVSAQKSKKDKLEREIRLLEEQLRENAASRKTTISTIELVNRKVEARRELVNESSKELRRINDSINLKKKQIAAVRAKLDTMTFYFNRLIHNAYKNRDARIWYIYILASDNLSQAAHRYGYLKTLSVQMNAQAKRIKAVQAELEESLGQLQVLQEKAAAVKKAHETELASLKKEESGLKTMLDKLNRNKKQLDSSIKTKKKQVEDLNREIKRIIEAAMAEQSGGKTSGKKPKAQIDYVLSGKFGADKGKLPWPVEDFSISERFGRHNHPVHKSIVMPFNNGINLSVRKGTKARCVYDGEVKKIIVMPGYNKCVLVQHGTYFTFYCKLGAVNVKAGQKISTGDIIGTVDTIDGKTELHFQLWNGKTPENPENWLRPY